MPRYSKQKTENTVVTSGVRRSGRRRTPHNLSIAIPPLLSTPSARVLSPSCLVLNALGSNGRTARRANTPYTSADYALSTWPQGRGSVIPIDPVLLAPAANGPQGPSCVPSLCVTRSAPNHAESITFQPHSPERLETGDAENAMPQVQWPPEEPGKSWNSYVPRTPIPIRLRNNTADKPERPLNPIAPTSGWRRSNRLKVAQEDVNTNQTAVACVAAGPKNVMTTSGSKRHEATRTKSEYSTCFYRRCQVKSSDVRTLTRHMDIHFPARFQCKVCGKEFTRPMHTLKHPHHKRNERVLSQVSYWQDPKYKHELRRPEEGHYIWTSEAFKQQGLRWYYDLPEDWEEQ